MQERILELEKTVSKTGTKLLNFFMVCLSRCLSSEHDERLQDRQMDLTEETNAKLRIEYKEKSRLEIESLQGMLALLVLGSLFPIPMYGFLQQNLDVLRLW